MFARIVETTFDHFENNWRQYPSSSPQFSFPHFLAASPTLILHLRTFSQSGIQNCDQNRSFSDGHVMKTLFCNLIVICRCLQVVHSARSLLEYEHKIINNLYRSFVNPNSNPRETTEPQICQKKTNSKQTAPKRKTPKFQVKHENRFLGYF